MLAYVVLLHQPRKNRHCEPLGGRGVRRSSATRTGGARREERGGEESTSIAFYSIQPSTGAKGLGTEVHRGGSRVHGPAGGGGPGSGPWLGAVDP